MDTAYLHYFGQLVEVALANNPDGKARALAAIRDIVLAPAMSAHQQLAQLTDIIGREADNPTFGFDLINATPLTSFGKGGLAIQTAPDFRRALDVIVNYAETELLLYFFDYEIEGDMVCVEIRTRYPLAEGYEIGLAAVVQSSNALQSAFSGKSKNLTMLRCQRDELKIANIVSERTGAQVVTGCDADALLFPASLLGLKNPMADPVTFDRLVADLQQDIERHRQAELSDFVRMRVRASIGDPPSQSSLAQSAKLSERSFRHALSKQGASYQKLVREVRTQFAEAALREGRLSVAEIGYQLGFADPSNFTSSFKRWTGKTPKDYRQ